MNKEKIRPILLSILSNLFIFIYAKDPLVKTEPKIALRKNFTTMQIPVRSYYQWKSENLISGERGEILTKDGALLIPNVYVYAEEHPSSKKTLLVTIQTRSSIPSQINRSLKDDDFFILSKVSSNKKERKNKIEELFF